MLRSSKGSPCQCAHNPLRDLILCTRSHSHCRFAVLSVENKPLFWLNLQVLIRRNINHPHTVFSHNWYWYHVSPSLVTMSLESVSATGHALPRYCRSESADACVHSCCLSRFGSRSGSTFWPATILLACSSSAWYCSRVRNSGKNESHSYRGARMRVTSNLSTVAKLEWKSSRSVYICAPPMTKTLLMLA